MTGFNQTTASALTALAILAASAVPAFSGADRLRQANFDGNWSVLIVTEKGTCDRAYRYPVRISNGSVGYAGEASFNVSGSVGANGAVTVTVSTAARAPAAPAAVGARDGSGRWATASRRMLRHLDRRAPLLRISISTTVHRDLSPTSRLSPVLAPGSFSFAEPRASGRSWTQ